MPQNLLRIIAVSKLSPAETLLAGAEGPDPDGPGCADESGQPPGERARRLSCYCRGFSFHQNSDPRFLVWIGHIPQI